MACALIGTNCDTCAMESRSRRCNGYQECGCPSKKKRDLANSIQVSLTSVCENERFKPFSVEIENMDTGSRESLDLGSGSFSKVTMTSNGRDRLHSTLQRKKTSKV